jgi:SAM-dependent methyltransferase
MSQHEHYTFGDSDLAARRLALLAATFEPSSARLLRLVASLSPRHALDLGCGPGYSTRLLHAVVGPAMTTGIDQSAEHVARARELAPPGVQYDVHDVTAASFPGERPDLLYCRFLLTHLRSPEAALEAWAAAAAEGAALVVEETAEMASDFPALRRYYTLVGDMQAHYGQQLHVGRALAEAPVRSPWRTEHSVVRALQLPARQMARLHLLNLLTWRDDPYARVAFDQAELSRLATELAQVASGAVDAGHVRYGMRQLILTRR